MDKEENLTVNEYSQQKPLTAYHLPLTTKYWLAGCFVITVIAVFLRFYDLMVKPLHHDEGVNGYFLVTLFREGVYKYDPTNYHGPTLYYISLFFTKLFGLETLPIRWSVAIFGVLTVVLVFFLRDYIGRIGSLAAALFVALSPGMVYISRYFIHEMLFVFLSLAMVAGVLFFIEKRRAGYFSVAWLALILFVSFLPSALNLATIIGTENVTLVWILRGVFFLIEAVLVFYIIRLLLEWDEGRVIYLMLASVSAVLLFATKETAFITIGTVLIAAGCVWLWQKIYSGMDFKIGADELAPVALKFDTFREKLGDSKNKIVIALVCLAIFIYVGVLFFSSFFTYWEGVGKAFEAYAVWTKTGTKDHTQNGSLAYAKWLLKVESPILILSGVGALIALIKARHRFAVFTAFWAFGLFLAYSIIPYKTPWLALSFLLPMAIIAGYAVNEMLAARDVILKILGGLAAAAAIGILGYQTYDLNFVRYDDDSMPYVYAHTTRGFLDLIDKIEFYAEKSGKGKQTTIEVVSPDYWAMPWYTREYPKANYHSKIVPANTAEMIVAKKDDQETDVIREYSAHYKWVGTYPLRPGVELLLLIRKDLADADAKELYRLNEEASSQ